MHKGDVNKKIILEDYVKFFVIVRITAIVSLKDVNVLGIVQRIVYVRNQEENVIQTYVKTAIMISVNLTMIRTE
jgi:hypothetical protein